MSLHTDLELYGKDYFFGSSKDLVSSNILSQLQVIKHFPAFFNEVEGHSIGASVSLTELGGVMKHLERDKILGSDGLPVYFSITFFFISLEKNLWIWWNFQGWRVTC